MYVRKNNKTNNKNGQEQHEEEQEERQSARTILDKEDKAKYNNKYYIEMC
jgi:hypothetical protein